MRFWSVYILKCTDGSLYTGIALDVEARVRAHNAGRGAKYVRSRGGGVLVYQETCSAHAAALQREVAIKRMSRQQKLLLLSNKSLGKASRY